MAELRALRRVGIAIGSLVAAFLCVMLLGVPLMMVTGTPSGPETSLLGTLVALVLGGLIYRDIVRREARRPTVPAPDAAA